MKKNQKLILIITVIMVIIIILLLCVLIGKRNNKEEKIYEQMNEQINKSKDNNNEITNENIKFENVDVQTSVVLLKNANQYFSVSNCINIYINSVNKQDNEATYNLLNDEYIKEKNINKNEVYEIVKKFDKDKTFYPEEMYIKKGTVNTFYAKGYIDNSDVQEKSNKEIYYISVLIDNNNKTFCVIPLSENEYMNRKEIGDKSFIPKNNYNTVTLTSVSDEFLCKKAFNDYKSLLLYNYDEAYEKLDEEYRDKRFKNKNEFIEYLNEYKSEILNITILKYAVNYEDDYVEYVCQDQYDNYYIFKDTAVMNCTVKLDSYTILTEDFELKYKNAKDEKKVSLNVYRFINMLNNRDYENAYNILDDTFKANYYPTLNEFKNSMKSSLSSKYKITSSEYLKQTNLSVEKIRLEDYSNTNNTIDLTIIVKLDENGTGFKISFST